MKFHAGVHVSYIAEWDDYMRKYKGLYITCSGDRNAGYRGEDSLWNAGTLLEAAGTLWDASGGSWDALGRFWRLLGHCGTLLEAFGTLQDASGGS